MRLQYIFLLFLSFVLQNCATKSNKNLTCLNFKSGKFELFNSESKIKYIIERNEKFQIEKTFDMYTNEKIKSDQYFLINWKNDCEYQLLIDTTKSDYDSLDLQINSLGGLKCKILKVDGNCAEIETKLENKIVKSKMCKK